MNTFKPVIPAKAMFAEAAATLELTCLPERAQSKALAPALRRDDDNSFRRRGRVAAAYLSILLLASCATTTDPPLPKLAIDPSRIAVAGLSSGAYMATQAHLAFSDHLIGAGLVAGGPYQCADGQLDVALKACMAATVSPDIAAIALRTRERAADGRLAPLAGLAGDRVWLLHGAADTVVSNAVARSTQTLYETLNASTRVSWDGDRDIAHTFPTLTSGGDCRRLASPYLGACGFDAAGALMQALFGAAAQPVAARAQGQLQRFGQARYQASGRDAYLAPTGYVYVPADCTTGAPCGLLVAFHGCEQNADKVGEAFVRDAGFNRWADAERVVVLYPQTRSSYLPLNPKACWDWWGYSGADYDTRQGAQLRWLANASAALGAPLE